MPEGVGYGPQFTASTGLTLNYIGNHAYAYSGTFGASTTAATALEFTTGNEYIVGEFQLNQAIQFASGFGTNMVMMQIELNGEVVSSMIIGLTAADSQSWGTQKMIIPPYSTLKASINFDDNQSARLSAITFSGRIYK